MFIALGWSHYLLPEPEPSGLLSIPSGCRCLNLYVEGQRDFEGGCGLCYLSLELMGCLSIHEYSC